MNWHHIIELTLALALAIMLLIAAFWMLGISAQGWAAFLYYLKERKHRRRMERAQVESRKRLRPERMDGRPRKHFALAKPTFVTRCRIWEADDHIVVLGDAYPTDEDPWSKFVPCELCWKMPDMGPPRRLTDVEKTMLENAIQGKRQGSPD